MSDWKENVTGEMPCRPFDMVDVWLRDGGLSSGFARDFYWKVDHDTADIIKYKVRDKKTETPEEKEAFDSMVNNSELPNSSEWKNGDSLLWKNGNGEFLECNTGRYIGYDSVENKHIFVRTDVDTYCIMYTKHSAISKPETPKQKAERERLEAAYDLYLECHCALGYSVIGISDFKDCEDKLKGYLAIVDKTGYRKGVKQCNQ